MSTVEGTNNVEFGERLTALVNEIEQELLIGYVLDYATFQPELIEQAVQGAVSNVYQTLAIVLVVVMLFLGLRTGLIVDSFVPLTMLLGVIVMRLLEVEFQRMSIAAMIIALGMLVDNGIVVAEDIRVRLERGAERRRAAVEATQTLAIPLLVSSLTTIFAFMPMLLLEGSTGEYVRSLAQVVTTLLLASWLLSMTVTPAMCAWFMRTPTRPEGGEPAKEDFSGPMHRVYRPILDLALRSRLPFIIVVLLLLIGAVRLLGTVPTEFLPLGDRNQLLVYLDFEAGTDIRVVEPRVRRLTRWLADREVNPEISSHVAYIGIGGPRFFLALSPIDPDPHRAFVVITTETTEDVGPLVARINHYIDAQMPAARADAKRMWFGSAEPRLIEVRLIGANADSLVALAAQITEAFHAVPGTVGVKHAGKTRSLNSSLMSIRFVRDAPASPRRMLPRPLKQLSPVFRLATIVTATVFCRSFCAVTTTLGLRYQVCSRCRSMQLPPTASSNSPKLPISKRSGNSAESNGVIRSAPSRSRPATQAFRHLNYCARLPRPLTPSICRPVTEWKSAVKSRIRRKPTAIYSG